VFNLQRAIQACIDLAAHAVASEHLGLPESVRDNFVILKEKGVIGAELASRMLKMTGFRNIAVHNYQALDLNILKSILVNNLKDIEDFYSALLWHWGFAQLALFNKFSDSVKSHNGRHHEDHSHP